MIRRITVQLILEKGRGGLETVHVLIQMECICLPAISDPKLFTGGNLGDLQLLNLFQ